MIRKANKPHIYWHRYRFGPNGYGYWRVKQVRTRFKHMNPEEQFARIAAHTFCSKLNGRRP